MSEENEVIDHKPTELKQMPNEPISLDLNFNSVSLLNATIKTDKKNLYYDKTDTERILDLIIADYDTFEKHITNMQNYIADLQQQSSKRDTLITLEDLDPQLKQTMMYMNKVVAHKLAQQQQKG